VSEKLTERLEDYLATIYSICEERRVARPGEIATRLHVHGSSVTSALRVLADHGLINYAPYEFATLTNEGTQAARRVIQRHEVIREFLSEVLSVDSAEAEENAQRMEHAVTDEVLGRFVSFLTYFQTCSHLPGRWHNGKFVCNGEQSDDCEQCKYPFRSKEEG
jgi:DtxR family Mn-dependent transcriptional regulator